jgi:hypothetical protein
MKKCGLIVICLMVFQPAFAGKKLPYIGVAINNFVTAKPFAGFSKLFYSQLHPGITISTGFNWKEKPNHNLMQSFKLAYFSHRFVQRSIMIYSEFGYRYKAGSKLGLSVAIGAGYLHMIPGDEQFRQNKEGDWEKIRISSRPQAMLSLSLGIDHKISQSGIRAFIRYQNMLQTPFVPGYVPLLPYNVLHLGVTVPVKLFRKGGEHAK